MRTEHESSAWPKVAAARSRREIWPVRLSGPVGGRTGRRQTRPGNRPPWEGLEGRHGVAPGPSLKSCRDLFGSIGFLVMKDSQGVSEIAGTSEINAPPGQQIRRIRARARLWLAFLIGLWLLICAFVFIALWFHWEL